VGHNELIAVAIRDIDGDKYEAELLKKRKETTIRDKRIFG
jgi:hypothetical protein